MTTIEFFKSDAMIERYPNEPDTLTLTIKGNVQLTYSALRDTSSGDAFARIIDDDWLDYGTGNHWSDWVAFE